MERLRRTGGTDQFGDHQAARWQTRDTVQQFEHIWAGAQRSTGLHATYSGRDQHSSRFRQLLTSARSSN